MSLVNEYIAQPCIYQEVVWSTEFTSHRTEHCGEYSHPQYYTSR